MHGECGQEGHLDSRGRARGRACMRGTWEGEKMGDGNHMQAKCVRWAGGVPGLREHTLEQVSV